MTMDELVNLYLEQMGLSRQFKEREVCQVWPDVVGGMIASRTKSLRISEGKVFVSFTSSVVKNEILMVKEGLIKALNDRVGDNVVKDMSEKKQVRTMQVMVVFFIVLSVVIAMDPPTFIAQLMGISWGALAGAFLAPFMYGLYWKGVTRAAVWASFAAGVGITVLNLFFHFIASPINAGAVAMVAGLIVVPVVSVLTPKLKKDRVDEIFACYDEKVTITKKRSLEQN